MASYLIKKEIDITRQEGDTFDVRFIIPEILTLTAFSVVKFNVYTGNGKSVFERTMIATGQTVETIFAPAETKGKAGRYRWELQVDTQGSIYTIGKGNFTINPELIK
jgi:hypothetical protein